jgi:hypothetical protein
MPAKQLFKFLGVCLLFLIGLIINLIKRQEKAYSFVEIWQGKSNKRDDEYMRFAKEWKFIIGIGIFMIVLMLTIR